MNIVKIKTAFWIIFPVSIFIVIIYGSLRQYNREKLLNNSSLVFGILVEEVSEGKNPSGTFEYMVNGKKHEFDQIGIFSNISKGDTVLIEYAVEDPSVARVVDKYYMKKYKHLKK